jgi:hypothetical protein
MNKQEREKVAEGFEDVVDRVLAKVTSKIIDNVDQGPYECRSEANADRFERWAKRYFGIDLEKQGKVLTLRR